MLFCTSTPARPGFCLSSAAICDALCDALALSVLLLPRLDSRESVTDVVEAVALLVESVDRPNALNKALLSPVLPVVASALYSDCAVDDAPPPLRLTTEDELEPELVPLLSCASSAASSSWLESLDTASLLVLLPVALEVPSSEASVLALIVLTLMI